MLAYELARDLEEYAPISAVLDDTPLTTAEPLPATGAPLERDVLYLTRGTPDPECFEAPVHLLLLGGVVPEGYRGQATVIAIPDSGVADTVFRRVQELFREDRRLTGFAAHLLSMLAGNATLQQVVDEAYKILGNPVFVFDAGFALTAANWDVMSYDPEAKHFIENRYLSPKDMKAINFDHIHQRAMRSAQPVLVRNPNYQGDRIVARLEYGNKIVGHIVMTETNRPINGYDFKAVSVLRDVVVQLFQRDGFVRNSRGFHYEHLICDLLDGKIPLGQQLQERLAYVDFHFEALTYVVVAELGRTPQFVNPSYIRSRFESLLPGSCSVLYNGQILLIVTRQEKEAITRREIAAFCKYCEEENLYCGMSNPFGSVVELPQFYRQALRALELGADRAGLYIYKDYASEHLAAVFCAKEKPETFCHPAIRMLVAYDRKQKTELAKTLYHFLRCERNVVKTAQEMYLHRNTLSYRMKKIEALTRLDLEDPDTRQYLMLSFLVNSEWESL